MFGLGLTLLQSYWSVRLGLVGAKLGKHVITGSFYDKTHGERDPDAPYGLFQFKKRFAQYYFVGLMGSLWVTWSLLRNCAGYGMGERFSGLLEFLGGGDQQGGAGQGDTLHALIAATMLTAHLGRRYYETLSINIFSGRQLLHPWDVVFYLTDFAAMALTLAADIPSPSDESSFTLQHLSWRPLVGIPLFIFASKLQHQTHLKLAKLRKNRAGHVVTTAYKMPKDEWFEKLSSPHYFAKLLVYASLLITMGTGCTTLYWLSAYQAVNQLYLAHGTHNYYISKFENYPTDRKMLIPYLL